MRYALVALALSLSGCFQAVDIGTHDGATSLGRDAQAPMPPDAAALLDDAGHPIGRDAGPISAPDASLVGLDAGASCINDLQCPAGEICYSSGCADTSHGTCIVGCWDSTTCAAGKICQLVPNDCDDKNGLCVDPPGCTDDSQCPIGTACDYTGGGTQMYCITGCHNEKNCPAGDTCEALPCPDCTGGSPCACLGICQAPCTSDNNCPTGEVCSDFKDPGCPTNCVQGCHSDSDCHTNQTCSLPKCASCGCDTGTCVAKGCQGDDDCGAGEVCNGCGQCQPGCDAARPCQAGETCVAENCASCTCMGHCMPSGCQSDADCASGQICDPCGANGANECVSGCRDSSTCQPGHQCSAVVCSGQLCCPNQCEPTGCQSDNDCGSGEICNGCGQCQLGCDADRPCQAGETCVPETCNNCTCMGRCQPGPCQSDSECGTGEVCAGCTGGTAQCLPGCDADKPCPAGENCVAVACYACPCPNQCEPAATCQTDADCGGPGSGMVCEPSGTNCTSKACTPGCNVASDCPAGDSCMQTQIDCLGCACPGTCVSPVCTGGTSCSSDLDCAWDSSFCQNGCCTACPTLPPLPACPDPSQCYQPQGVNTDGCQTDPTCETCCTCPSTDDPVCALVPNEYNGNFQTYGNQCEASCGGATILHWGACLPYEGMGCGYYGAGPQVPCPAGLTCRDMCAVCDSISEARCAKTGACIENWDCPAGLTATCPVGKQATWSCLSNTCEYTCQ